MAHISDLIVDAMVDHLQTNLDIEYALKGWTLATVKAGRLQDDPERPDDHILVHINHPRDDNWYDQPVGGRYLRYNNVLYGYEDGYMSVLGEVGGGRRWLRRFAIEISNYYTRNRREQGPAREDANIVRGLVEKHAMTLSVTGITDEFGEQGVRIWESRSRTDEKGGPPNSYIWKSYIYVTVETSRPGC